ncbi:MAG: pknD [Mucilaginibacter sp.]|nr:pknD [Mucilaginibacter sp.]
MNKNDISYRNRFMALSVILLFAGKSFSQAPNLHYGGPYTFAAGTVITPVVPSNTGGAVTAQVSLFASGFNHPADMAVDGSNNIYLADQFNNRIKKITPSGVVSVFAGSGSQGSADGTGTAASFYYPAGVAIDNNAGILYVADYSNNRIRAINISTQQVTTFAGSGYAGGADGNGISASFNGPLGMAMDGSGNIYVADYTGQKIRKITSSGIVTTLAGNGSQGTTDGTGAAAYFNYPSGLRADASGNVYVTDRSSDLIRKITPSGVVTTIAGNAYSENSSDGYGSTGNFYRPSDLVLDNGIKYITDYLGNKIREIDAVGNVTTVAGSGSAGAANGSGLSATFNGPFGIVMDISGNLYVSDIVNNAIRKITLGQLSISPSLPPGLVFDPITGIINGTPNTASAPATYTITASNTSGTTTSTVNISVITGSSINASQDRNYLITYTPRTPIADITQFAGAAVDQVNQTVAYFDGLGRPVQTVQWQGSTTRKDVVQAIAYDQYGREITKYLPYANNPNVSDNGSYKADAITQQTNYYSQNTTISWDPNVVKTPYPFASSVFEQSPLNRPVEQGAPGQVWQPGSGHTVQTAYGGNATNEVLLWSVNSNGNGAATGNNYYAQNTLYKTTVTDENGNNVLTFNDMQGKVVCKMVYNGSLYLATYYVYDDSNNLAYVIPPIPAGTTYPTSFVETDPVFLNFIYGYHYDGRNRLIQKNIPGKGAQMLVYNLLDELVLSQDAVQSGNNQWTVTKYDGQGRVIVTGLWNAGTTIPQATLQNSIYSGAQWDTRDFSNNVAQNPTGYILSSYPQLSQPLTVNYYDDYNFPGNPYGVSGIPQPTGLVTATKVTILNANGTYGPMLWTVNNYDDKGRVTATYKQHYLGGIYSTNNYDLNQVNYYFDNQPSNSYRFHYTVNNTANWSLRMDNAYYYDHTGRKYRTYTAVNGAASIMQNQFVYNEIGQLKTKRLHSANDGASFLQSIDYSYNERGWLTQSNAPLFAMQLNYNINSTTGPFNGNISSQYWETPGNGTKNFTYSYDPLNRLTDGASNDSYAEHNISYDYLGNILALSRVHPSAGINASYNYNYNYNGNQLASVTGLTGSYQYDPNGNVDHDGRTGKDILYNILNLPRNVSASGFNMNYTYTADGEKLQKNNGSTTTDYISGIQYRNGAADFIQTEEGRVLNLTGTVNYEYSLTDHLGNTRVTFDSSTGASMPKQADDYLPFGMEISRTLTGAKNEYLYNKKEFQEETQQYDYGARFYDPVIGRWGHIDPKAELYFSITPYAYAANTPVNAIDPDGHLVIFVAGQNAGNGASTQYWGRSYTSTYNSVTHRNGSPHTRLVDRFDVAVENHFNDDHVKYYDGALGGWSNTFASTAVGRLFMNDNLFLNDRMDAGHDQGEIDAGAIINSLARTNGVITESIKIIAHSMGAAYAKGLIKAIVEYAKSHPQECRGLSITEYDFGAYQQNQLSAIPGVPLYQYDNNGDLVVGLTSGHAKEKGQAGGDSNVNSDGGHSITDFMSAVNKLEPGNYKYINGQFVKQP